MLIETRPSEVTGIDLYVTYGWCKISQHSKHILTSLIQAEINQGVIIIVSNRQHHAGWFIDVCCCVRSSGVVFHSRKNQESIIQLLCIHFIMVYCLTMAKPSRKKIGTLSVKPTSSRRWVPRTELNSAMEIIPIGIRKIYLSRCLPSFNNKSHQDIRSNHKLRISNFIKIGIGISWELEE